MNKSFFTPRLQLVGILTTLVLSVTSCKKEEAKDPLLACRPASGGTGVGIPNPRTVMFWTRQNLNCGSLSLVSIRNTETNSPRYASSFNTSTITQYFATQPACGSAGSMTIQVSKGYQYEYTIACSGRQWKDTFTADCNDDCIAILLQ